MYFKAIVAVTAGLLIGSTSLALGEGAPGHCIALWADFKNFHSLLPDPASARRHTGRADGISWGDRRAF
jgi:hypothetical protein